MTEIQFTDDEIDADPILHGLRRDGIPLTRESYIIRNWGVIPVDWDAEAEDALPEKLQNWDQFEKPTAR